MRLYLVVSEEMKEIIWEDYFANAGHIEYYRIAELVLAEKPSQAKWAAWSTDKKTFDGNVLEIPRFSIRYIGQFPQESKRRIVSRDPAFEWYWNADGPTSPWPLPPDNLDSGDHAVVD